MLHGRQETAFFPVREDVREAEVVVLGLGVEVEEVGDVEVARAQRVPVMPLAAGVAGPVVVDLDSLHVELQHQPPPLHVVQLGLGVNPGTMGMDLYALSVDYTCTGSSEINGAKFSDTCSVRADWLCMGWPFCLSEMRREFQTGGKNFCTTLYMVPKS